MNAFAFQMLFRKILKFFCIALSLWALAIFTNIMNSSSKHKNILRSGPSRNVQLNFCGNGEDMPGSSFKVWEKIPAPDIMKEKLSVIRDSDILPGQNGRPVFLKDELRTSTWLQVKKGWDEHAFNSFVSHLIPVNRTLFDPRDDWCKSRVYSNHHQRATVVICFHNEAWSTLLRTIHSVLDRTPASLLDEVILVDDGSTMTHLHQTLEEYIHPIPKVKLIRTYRREGLIRARIIGVKQVKSPVVVFLDSHCECTKGWLEPLVDRIVRNPTIVASPVVDHIHDSTFEYIAHDVHDLRIGGFTWEMKFKWIAIPHEFLYSRDNGAAPIESPTISGGLFAINNDFFKRLGYYDDGFEIWGAENLELSFKTWMCGGSIEIVPCSHVGHVFRKRFPYVGQKGSAKRNAVRLAEVWLDEYAKYFYQRIGYQRGDYGDVTKMKELRERLKCKSFKWYLEHVYPQMNVPDHMASGKILSLNYYGMCLDASGVLERIKDGVNLFPCHNQGGNQFWVYTKSGNLKLGNLCLDYILQRLRLNLCHGGDSQIWLYDDKIQKLKQKKTQHCLTGDKRNNKYRVTLEDCVKLYSQKWVMDNFDIERHAPELQQLQDSNFNNLKPD